MNRRDLIPLTFLLLALAGALTGCASQGFGEHGTFGVNVSDPKDAPAEPGLTYSGAVRPTYDPEVLELCAARGWPDYLWCQQSEQEARAAEATRARPRDKDGERLKDRVRDAEQDIAGLKAAVGQQGSTLQAVRSAVAALEARVAVLELVPVPVPDPTPVPDPQPTPALPPDWPAWWAVLSNASKDGVQVARPAPNQKPYGGAQWAVNDHVVYGLGDTIELAFADYRRKGGKLWNPGTAPTPTAAQLEALRTFQGLDRKPTSIRRAGNGVYFCDYYRGPDLHSKTEGHSTPEAAVAALRAALGDRL